MITSRLALRAKSGGALHTRPACPADPECSRAGRPGRFRIRCSRVFGTVFMLAAALSPAEMATGASVTLAWDANPETNIASYKLSYGTAPGVYPNVVNAGTNLSATVSNLAEGGTYYFSVAAVDRNGAQSPPSGEISHYILPSNLIPPVGWRLHHVDSEEAIDYPATGAFDGDPATFWHTDWKNGSFSSPRHEIQIDLGSVQGIGGFRYLPRQDSILIGNIALYEFYVSADGINWGPAVASGTFARDSREKEVLFAAKSGRYIRLVSLSEVNGGTDCNVAEIQLIKGIAAPLPSNQAPVALAQSVTTAEDSSTGVVLGGTDADGNVLVFSLVTQPTRGALSGVAPNLVYTPHPDFNGSDSFTFRVHDGTVESAVATVSITVSPVNDAPVALARSLSTPNNSPLPVVLTGSDKDGDVLAYSISSGPSNGALSGIPPAVTYTANAGFSGSDSFTFLVNDGSADSAPATVTVEVTPANDAPVAIAGAVVTPEDTAVAIPLAGTDRDSDPLTYAVVSGPANGLLSGTPPNLTYTPFSNYHGSDSFTFRVHDGKTSSATATVSISVTPVNDTPVANSRAITVSEDGQVPVVLTASDADGDTLAYSITAEPANGTLSGTAPNVTYKPAANFNGTDSFSFRVHDGTVFSATATVSITITAVNDAPVALSRSVTTAQDTALPLVLTGTDVENSPLSFTVVTGPANGTLSGTPPNLVYQPNSGFTGTDSLTFRASDGAASSANATISITVTKKAPFPGTSVIAQTGWSLKYVDSQETFDSPAIHAFDGNPNTFWHTQWRNGTTAPPPHEIQINLGSVKSISGFQYLPRQDQYSVGNVGDYEFYVSTDGTTWGNPVATGTFTNDKGEKQVLFTTKTGQFVRFRAMTEASGHVDTCVAELNVLQGSVTNRTPLATGQTLTMGANSSLPVTLAGSDPDGNPLTYSISSHPAHGTLSGTPPNISYVPDPGYSGSDQFSFQTNDGAVFSNSATVSVTVTPAVVVPGNTPPAFTSNPISASATEDLAFSGQLAATDANGDRLIFGKISGPGWLSVSSSGALGGTPSNGDVGMNTFTVRVSDPSNASATAVLNIRVANANDAPVFKIKPLVYPSGTEKMLYRDQTLASVAEDPDQGDRIHFSKTSGPAWLTVSSTGALGGTPPAGSAGVNQFRIRVTDTAGAFSETTLQIRINDNTLPLPWNLDRVGTGNLAGAARYSSGTFTLAGAGALYPTTDGGNYGWQRLSADGQITARIAKVHDTGSSTSVGVMIRGTLASNSRQVFLGVNGDGNFQWFRRSLTGGKMSKSVRKNTGPDKVWLRLVRKKNTFSAYQSKNGVKWTFMGKTKVTLPKNCYIGLLVSSGNKDKLNTSKFSNVKVVR